MIHDGDTYFEQCYGADFDARVSREHKEGCWQAWIAHYTRHQPAHRVDYAMRRIEALQNGEPPPVLPGLVSGALSSGEVRAELAAVDAAAGNTGSSLIEPTIERDGGPVPNGCLSYCNTYEGQCLSRCVSGNVACRQTCERERALCLHGCY